MKTEALPLDSQTSPALLVLAAGMGSRYGGLKQLDPMGPDGETLLDFSLRDAYRAGFRRVVFVIRREMHAAFEAALGERLRPEWAVDYVYQELDALPPGHTLPPGRTKPWGTAHAVWVAREAIRTPLAVINADDYYGPTAYAVLYRHLTKPDRTGDVEYAMVGYRLRDTLSAHGSVSRGVCRADAAGRLQAIEEMTAIKQTSEGIFQTYPDGRRLPLTGDETVSMNIWGFTPVVFAQLERVLLDFLTDHVTDPGAECYIPSMVNRAVAEGWARVRVLPGGNEWFGVTYREDREHVRQRLQARMEQAPAADGREEASP